MPLIRKRWITREFVRANPSVLFVFGDNLARVGFGGQARECRGEPNAVGLPTKRSPHEYLRDSDWKQIEAATSRDRDRLIAAIVDGKTVVWPEAGIGTGLARLREEAPAIAEWYDRLLLALEL